MPPVSDRTEQSEGRREALSIAALAFALAAPTAYVLQRLVERIQGGEPDPLVIARTMHVAFYWRVATAVWWGGLAAMLVWAIVRRRGDHGWFVDRFAWAVSAVGIGVFLLSWMLP